MKDEIKDCVENFENYYKYVHSEKDKEILDILKDDIYIPSDDNRKYKLLDRDDTRHLLDYITNLQTIEREYSNLLSENAELQQENDRSNNIINELEKWLNEFETKEFNYNFLVVRVKDVQNKLKELKENK